MTINLALSPGLTSAAYQGQVGELDNVHIQETPDNTEPGLFTIHNLNKNEGDSLTINATDANLYLSEVGTINIPTKSSDLLIFNDSLATDVNIIGHQDSDNVSNLTINQLKPSSSLNINLDDLETFVTGENININVFDYALDGQNPVNINLPSELEAVTLEQTSMRMQQEFLYNVGTESFILDENDQLVPSTEENIDLYSEFFSNSTEGNGFYHIDSVLLNVYGNELQVLSSDGQLSTIRLIVYSDGDAPDINF